MDLCSYAKGRGIYNMTPTRGRW